MIERNFLFLLTSARSSGNSEILAKEAAKSVINTNWIDLNNVILPPFVDRRHHDGYALPENGEKILFDATILASDIVLVAPIYWYNLPANAKLYLDYWSAWLRHKEINFRQAMNGKNLWLITVNSDEIGNDSGANPLIETLKSSAAYLGMNWRACLMGHGSKPGDVLNDKIAISKARNFFL